MDNLEPPDLEQCQAEKPGNGPFIMGGTIGDSKRGFRIRCTNKPDVIAKERKPGPDGKRGSMSLCFECRNVLVVQSGNGFATFKEIK